MPPGERPADTVDPKLLEILVCPLTKTPLEYDAEKQELISRAAKLAYRSCCPKRRGGLSDAYGGAQACHARPCAGHPRLYKIRDAKVVDGRDVSERSDAVLRTAMPGHDGRGRGGTS
jgi:hypothetical protein